MNTMKIKKIFSIVVLVLVMMAGLVGCTERKDGKVRIVDLEGTIKQEIIDEVETIATTEDLVVVFAEQDVPVRQYAIDDDCFIILVMPAELLVLNEKASDTECKAIFDAVVTKIAGLDNQEAVKVLVEAVEKEMQLLSLKATWEMIKFVSLAAVISWMLIIATREGWFDGFGSGYGNTFVYVSRGSSRSSGLSGSTGGSFRGHR